MMRRTSRRQLVTYTGFQLAGNLSLTILFSGRATGFPSSTLLHFLFGVSLLKPKSRKKGTLTIKGLLGNLGKEHGQSFKDVASRIDTVVFGPHASAAFPTELKPFISASLSRRKQFLECSLSIFSARQAKPSSP